jgi:ribosome maturation factor RimP
MPQTSRTRSVPLADFLRPAVAAAGFDLEDVSVTSAGRRSIVRIVIDADGGVDLDDVATVSRTIADHLDDEAATRLVGAGPYVLEVSSPGVDRPLDEPRHWRRAIGRLVRVSVADAELTGRVTRTTDDAVGLDVAGVERLVPWGELGRGHVEVEFHRPDGAAAADAAADDGVGE